MVLSGKRIFSTIDWTVSRDILVSTSNVVHDFITPYSVKASLVIQVENAAYLYKYDNNLFTYFLVAGII